MGQQLVAATAQRTDLRRVGGLLGMVGPILFATTFLLQDLLRTDGDAVAEPVSALAIGAAGWVQQLNFVVFGVLMLVFAVGLHHGAPPARAGWVGPALLGVAGLGLFVAAAFSLERDRTGAVYDPGGHQVGGVMFFGGVALALLALSRRLAHDPGWRRLSRHCLVAGGLLVVGGGPVMNLLAIPAGAPLHDYAGLLQRVIVLVIMFPCLVALAHRLSGARRSPA